MTSRENQEFIVSYAMRQQARADNLIVSFAAVRSRNAPPEKRLLTSEPHSFHEICQSRLPFHFQERFRAKFALWNLPNQRMLFYLCIPSSETSQMDMRISGFCLGTPKNTSDAWMSLVFSWRLFKVKAELQASIRKTLQDSLNVV